MRYLEKCFYTTVHRLVDSESRHRMDLKIHYDTQLREAEEHIVAAVRSLKELVASDQNLTPGSECAIPEVTCREPVFPTHVSHEQI